MNLSSFKQQPSKKLLLTKEGLDKLKKRLDEITMTRHKAVKELQLIDRDDVDELNLSTQVQKLEITEIEATKLSELLQHVEPVIKKGVPEQVATGCTVRLKAKDSVVMYTIVCPLELDIENNKISEESTLGQAVLGKRVGDSFSIVTPKGSLVSYDVVSIS